jgi:hypothetical protein
MIEYDYYDYCDDRRNQWMQTRQATPRWRRILAWRPHPNSPAKPLGSPQTAISASRPAFSAASRRSRRCSSRRLLTDRRFAMPNERDAN